MLKKRSSESKTLSVSLLEPIVFTGSNMDASPVLRGTVNVHLTQSCTLARLYLKFNGSMKTYWREDFKYKDQHKSVASERLLLYPPANGCERYFTTSRKPLTLKAGTTRFSFEMPLPAGIPETINCSHISVQYHLSVCLDYQRASTTFSHCLTNDHYLDMHDEIKEEIILARVPDTGMLTGENQHPSFRSNKYYSNWCQYRITLDKKAVAIGSHLPITVEIMPTVKHLRLRQLFLQLIERRTITTTDQFGQPKEKTSQSVLFLHPAKDAQQLILPSMPLKSMWEGSCVYQIPHDEKVLTHSSQTYADFKVSHILLVSIVVSVPNSASRTSKFHYFSSNANKSNCPESNNKTFSFQTPIDLVNGDAFQTWDMTRLPSYDSNPITTEELEKLQTHGIVNDAPPPAYEEILCSN